MSGKFSSSKVSATRDMSTFKTMLVGLGGAGKTFFLSTIVSKDKRPIFLLSVEEGGKGISPNHAPKHFDGARYGTWAIPETFDELIDAMRTFRDEVNALQPPTEWLERAGEHRPTIEALVRAFPTPLTATEIAEKTRRSVQDLTPVLRALADAKLIKMVDKQIAVKGSRVPTNHQAYVAVPDSTWLRPHAHFGVDSTSGVEKLIHAAVTSREGVQSMADKEYAALWLKALPLWETFLAELDAIRATNVHVWLIAHATEAVDADTKDGKFFRKLDMQMRGTGPQLDAARAVLRNWADNVYYLILQTDVRDGSKKARARGSFAGRRLITTYTGLCMAKTRPQVPAELPATWDDLRRAWEAGIPAKKETLIARIDQLIVQLREIDAVLADEAVTQRDGCEGDPSKLAEVWSRLQGVVACAIEEQQALKGATDEGEEPEEPGASDGPPGEPRPPSSRDGVSHPDNATGHASL